MASSDRRRIERSGEPVLPARPGESVPSRSVVPRSLRDDALTAEQVLGMQAYFGNALVASRMVQRMRHKKSKLTRQQIDDIEDVLWERAPLVAGYFREATKSDDLELETWIEDMLSRHEKDLDDDVDLWAIVLDALRGHRTTTKSRADEAVSSNTPVPSIKQPAKRARDEPAGEDALDIGERQEKRSRFAPAEQLEDMMNQGSTDSGWRPAWTRSLTKLITDPRLVILLENDDEPTMDPDSEPDARWLLSKLKTLAELSSDRPNHFAVAAEALRWHEGIPGRPSFSGFGTLDISEGEASGRPSFPGVTQENLPVTGGQHRRHVVAWHTISAFFSLAYVAHPEVVLQAIWDAFTADTDDPAHDAFAEALKHLSNQDTMDVEGGGGRWGRFSPEQLLKMGLYVINGNTRNLWVGLKDTNSAINTGRYNIQNALERVTSFDDLFVLAAKWTGGSGGKVYSSATSLAANVLWQRGLAAREAYDANQDKTELEYVRAVMKIVDDTVVSNLGTDLMADDEKQAEILQDRRTTLENVRMTIDHVMTGEAQIEEIDEWVLSELIRDFLRYLGD